MKSVGVATLSRGPMTIRPSREMVMGRRLAAALPQMDEARVVVGQRDGRYAVRAETPPARPVCNPGAGDPEHRRRGCVFSVECRF